jgi:hypothetical protein
MTRLAAPQPQPPAPVPAPALPRPRGDGARPAAAEPVSAESAAPGHAFGHIAIHPGAPVPTGGGPLGGDLRTRMESRLGTRVGDVRLHHGPPAARAAGALGVPAFAVGPHVVLGPAADEHLLAHELAHTVQQAGAVAADASLPRTDPGGPEERQAEAAARGLERPTPGAPLALAAAPDAAAGTAGSSPPGPAAALPFPPSRRFGEIYPEFEKTRVMGKAADATVLAREAATAPYDMDDLLHHGIEVVDWLFDHGDTALAGRLLENVRSAWMIEFVSIGGQLPPKSTLTWSANDPGVLVHDGREAARAGNHALAFQLLGTANEILSFYALTMTEARIQQVLEDDEAEAELLKTKDDPVTQAALTVFPLRRSTRRSFQYGDIRAVLDTMREIYGVYSALEREALEAGDAAAAAAARSQSAALHAELKAKYSWGGTQAPGLTREVLHPVEIAEVSYTDTPKGPGLTLHGANHAETDLTQLPGLPSPKEVGNNVQVQNLGALQDALMAQTELQAELAREPEVRKAFGNQPVDLNDTKARQRAWGIMYGVYAKAGSAPLAALMALVGRYLKAYTIHTNYNVRDWGKSYLDTEMPTDLAGRAERDCGVYALTVAWDVYKTVKAGDPKLDVSFELTAMLEHVTLVIRDRKAGEHYMVNNDTVSGPHKGDPLEQVAPAYGAITGVPYTVGPAVTMGLGSTKDSPTKFHDDAWTRYKASADWGLHLDVPPDVLALKKTDPAAFGKRILEIQKARYEKFYQDQLAFDRGTKALDKRVDAELLPVAGDTAKLAPAVETLTDAAGPLAVLFIQLGPSVGVDAGSAASAALLPKQAQYLFTLDQGHTVHPLARLARAVLRVQAQGGTPTAKEQALVKFCETVPQFKAQLDAYRAAGATGPF